MRAITREEIENIKAEIAKKPTCYVPDEIVLKLIESHERAVKMIERIPDFGPEEPSENACWFCDMGAAGYSSKGNGFHDDKCLWGEARAFLQRLDGGDE